MIPNSSQVLIVGAGVEALVLAVSLAKAGLEVLVIEENLHSFDTPHVPDLDEYDKSFLEGLGYAFGVDYQIDLKNLHNQSTKILANSLCNVLWETKLRNVETSTGKFVVNLESKEQKVLHQTSVILFQKDLAVTNSFSANLKNIILYSWKIVGYIGAWLSPHALKNHQEERDAIANYYAEDDLSKSIFHKFFDRILNKKKGVLNFRDSKINLHLSQFRNISAGDLLPHLKVYDEKLKLETSLNEWCKFGKFSLIIFGDIASYNLTKYANWLKSNYKLEVFYLPFTERNSAVFKLFEIPEGENKTIIVRPDKYIGFVNDRVELEIIENYLNNVLFMYPNLKAFSPKVLNSGQ